MSWARNSTSSVSPSQAVSWALPTGRPLPGRTGSLSCTRAAATPTTSARILGGPLVLLSSVRSGSAAVGAALSRIFSGPVRGEGEVGDRRRQRTVAGTFGRWVWIGCVGGLVTGEQPDAGSGSGGGADHRHERGRAGVQSFAEQPRAEQDRDEWVADGEGTGHEGVRRRRPAGRPMRLQPSRPPRPARR